MALLAIAMTTGEKNGGPTEDCSNAGVGEEKELEVGGDLGDLTMEEQLHRFGST